MFTCSLNLKALLDNCAHIALSNAEGDGMWLRSFFDALLFFSDFLLELIAMNCNLSLLCAKLFSLARTSTRTPLRKTRMLKYSECHFASSGDFCP